METKASYVVVGAFALLVVMGALLFVLWAAKNSKGDTRTYEVAFHQSVAGLTVGSSVQLEGVRIGQVSSIRVSPSDPGQVLVQVTVGADAPIRQNSQATLEPQGVTGMSVVAISGGTADSPLVNSVEGQMARIPAQPSRLQEIMNSVPSILASLDNIVKRTDQLISPENTEALGTLLLSVTEIAETLAQNKESIARGMVGFSNAGDSFAASGRRLEALIASSQTLVDRDFRNAAQSVNKASSNIAAVASAVEPGLHRFSRDSMRELHALLAEARTLVTHLSNLSQKLESDSRRFLFGNPVPEFSLQ